ncbi:MAG: D-2-hydroxyacid dehydrogenase family protein [Ostreibacterium sp.]
MKKCIILDDYQKVGLKYGPWESLAKQVSVSSITRYVSDENELVALLKGAEIIMMMRERTPFPASLLKQLPRLELLLTSGMRNAAIDLAVAKEQGITVCGTTTHGEPPVELAWALILGLVRHIVPEVNGLRNNGPWQTTVGIDLYGKTIGLVGVGKLGKKMATIASAFGMKVQGWSPNFTPERAEEAGVEYASSLIELMQSSDIVSVHLVLSDSTRGLIGAEQLSQMSKAAYLINTSRAPIVDEVALIEALQQKTIAGAGIDVFDPEPIANEHVFRTLLNLLAMPHLGYVTERNYQTFYTEAVEDVRAWLSGHPVRVIS